MIKTLLNNPYSTTAKTAEIMSRYRPIAPKPENESSGGTMSEKIRQSPYLRNVWPQLQARPTRTRKRGRASAASSSLSSTTTTSFKRKGFSLQMQHGFSHHLSCTTTTTVSACAATPSSSSSPSLVTLPLLPCCMEGDEKKVTNLVEIPEEKDFLKQLQGPIAPQPIRPVGSSIIVRYINEEPSLHRPPIQVQKKPEEVEDYVESESMPVVISDSNNKVRLANSAYKELVGQPECPWLDSMVNSEGRSIGNSSCNRICGEITLNLSDSGLSIKSTKGFSCWVRIEWGNESQGNNKNNKESITAFCDVMRFACKSKDYLFAWRFHIQNREASQTSSTNI